MYIIVKGKILSEQVHALKRIHVQSFDQIIRIYIPNICHMFSMGKLA